MEAFKIRPIRDADKPVIDRILTERWTSTEVVSRGVLYRANELPGFVALMEERIVGLLTYHLERGACEIVSLDSLIETKGVGSALLKSVEQVAKSQKCNRIWLITTNDNIAALRFYQRREYLLVAIHRNALDVSRQLKPRIPLVGMNGIPLRDEIELEKIL